VRPNRIEENIEIDFALASDEVVVAIVLDTGVRGGPDPEDRQRLPFKVEH
jgi:hypothetical protein